MSSKKEGGARRGEEAVGAAVQRVEDDVIFLSPVEENKSSSVHQELNTT
jgi:hypothetical protein